MVLISVMSNRNKLQIMKRIFKPILALLALCSVMSCNEDVTRQIGTDMKGVLGVTAFEGSEALGAVSTYEVGKRQVKSISLKAYAEEVSGVALKVTFGTDASYVDVYNEANGTNYQMLPGDAFAFGESDVLMPRFNVYSAESKLTLIGQGCEDDVFYLLPVTITKVVGTENYEISEATGVIYFLMKVLPASKGTGTKDDPFLITEIEDFKTMSEKIIPGDKVYFNLQTDLDLTEVTSWTSLNNSSPYDCTVYFNGNGHKISNYTGTGGIFHVLNGSVENLVIEDANVAGGANTGILANYIGYTGCKANVKNVTVRNSKFSGANDSGLLSGYTYNAVVENVYIDNCESKLTGRRGGLITGRMEDYSEIINCYARGGKCYDGTQQCGGLVGQVNVKDAKIANCGISSEISANRAMGAIVSYVKGPDGHTTVENCIVWTPKMVAVTEGNAGKDQYSSGAVVGCSEQNTVTYKNNYRRADFIFSDQDPAFGPAIDQPNIEMAKLPTTASNSFFTHAFGYHGVAADAGKTASQVAKDLGWDETIWDLSGDEPVLK